ncbi:LysM peptidoglycan-binding domain-containing protein [Planctomycetales bacterium ZRK34]|nr:LysM peptidoglycan-binding domain-containing protein [Planctomycetales bacterium ZRK34]
MSLVNDALKRASESSRQAPSRQPVTMPLTPPQAAPISRSHRPPVFAVAAIVAVTAMVALCVTALTTDWLGPRSTVAATPDASADTGPMQLIPDHPRAGVKPPTPSVTHNNSLAPLPQPKSALHSVLEQSPAPAVAIEPTPIPTPQIINEPEVAAAEPTPDPQPAPAATPVVNQPPTPVITKAPAAAPAAAPDKADDAAFKNYTVTSGDTLSSIAARFFGKPTDWHKLYELNRHRIENPDRLQVGMTLQVPAKK